MSTSSGLSWVTVLTAARIACADGASPLATSSSAMDCTSSSVSWAAQQREQREVVDLRYAFGVASPEPTHDVRDDLATVPAARPGHVRVRVHADARPGSDARAHHHHPCGGALRRHPPHG